MVNVGYGQFIACCLCCSLSLRGKTPQLQREGSSHRRQFSTHFSNESPSHGLQLFINCPSVGPFLGVQSFRNRLPQRGSPMGSQALPANLLRYGLLSPQVHRSWQEPAPAWGSLRGHSLFRAHPPALVWGPFHRLQMEICSTVDLHGLQEDSLPHHGLHHELQGKTPCLGIWSTSSPSFFADLGVCRAVSLTCSHSSLTAISPQIFFFPFLNMLSQRHYHHC